MVANRVTYVISVAALVLLVYLYDFALTFAALYAVLALPLLSLALALISKRRFTVTEVLDDESVVKGQSTRYLFYVKNNSFLPCPSVRVRFKASSSAITADFADQLFAIGPRKVHEAAFNISAKYRGVYEIGVLDITLYDFLGLFRFKQAHGKTLTLVVRPRVLELGLFPLATAESGMDTAKDFAADEDYAMISDLRKYRPTDGYKRIHWKVSAKKNELISKNYQNTRRNSTVLLLDNSEVKGGSEDTRAALEDLMMEACVSVLSQCVRRRQLCAAHYIGGQTMGAPTDNFDYLYGFASEITYTNKADFDALYANYTKMQVETENLIVLVQEISDTVLAASQSLKLFGNNVIVLYFSDPKQEEKNRIFRLLDQGVHCVDFRKCVIQAEPPRG